MSQRGTRLTEPTIQRGTLWFWLILSLGVALAIIALGVGLEPRGAAVLRAPLSSPAAGAFAFGLLLVWAAYAYALAAGRAAGSRELTLVGLNLALPLLWMLLLLAGHILPGIVSALAWAISLLVLGVILVQREPLAGLMMLPLFGASLTASLLTLTLWLMPAPAG
jgi:uncharacterized membrane-anchored protein